MKYADELTKAMTWLGEQPDTFFIGQSVAYPGTAMFNTLKEVKEDKRLELPVAEEMQMGMTLGLSLTGIVPISIFPRWNFLILGANQLINHIDKLRSMSTYTSKIIIRVGIGSERPLHPQHQHAGDYTKAFQFLCPHTQIIRLDEPEQIFEAYRLAYLRKDNVPTILVEWADYYNEK